MNRLNSFFLFTGLGLIFASAAALAANENQASDGVYPSYSLSSTEVYDSGSLKAYTGTHQSIYTYIDNNLEAHFGNLQRWVRQPSISAQNVGITEMAELLRDDLAAIGFSETRLVPTSGHPGVWGSTMPARR